MFLINLVNFLHDDWQLGGTIRTRIQLLITRLFESHSLSLLLISFQLLLLLLLLLLLSFQLIIFKII